MEEPELIWRFGRWIARRESGLARLAWSSGSITLQLHGGRVVSVEGLDTGEIARRLGCAPLGRTNLLDEARALAAQQGVAEMQAVGCAKEMLERGLHAWFHDPQRQLEITDDAADAGDGATISITHAIVELVLNDSGQDLSAVVLPDLNVLLRRAANFLELYAPLRLSEDADLIVAKITGQRTAEEIASRSPHGSEDVIRLLAALVATGMLEPVPVVSPTEEVDLLPSTFPEDEPARRRLPIGLVFLLAAALVAVLVVTAILFLRARAGSSAPSAAHWTIVVDMGCEPHDLQRVLRKANQQPQTLRAVKASGRQDEPCWRLVWGHFSSRSEAVAAIPTVPSGVRGQGFEPHPIELNEASEPGPAGAGQEQ